MTLAITICATGSYTYAMNAQARRVAANVRTADVEPGYLLLVGDKSKAIEEVHKVYETVLPEGWKIMRITNPSWKEGQGDNYKERAQLLIAAMREDAFTACRKLGVDFAWSLDSDVLPPPNALRCSLDMLRFDSGYYSIASCPYPNGLWLGGRGTYTHPIAEDFSTNERIVPWKLQRALAACERRMKGEVVPHWHQVTSTEAVVRWGAMDPARPQRGVFWYAPTPETVVQVDYPAEMKRAALERERQRFERLQKRLKDCPPDGNIWQVTAKHGWRRRGWLDYAYPGIGRGAVLPSDWCGFGCTLLNREALALASFEGYDGRGTEDLFCIWRRWTPAGLRICVITHCPCSHVIWHRKKVSGEKTTAEALKQAEGSYTLLDAYHEPEGECVGHLRIREVPWAPER